MKSKVLPGLPLTYSRDKFLFPATGKISQSYFAFLLLSLKQEQQADLVTRDALGFRSQSAINQLKYLAIKCKKNQLAKYPAFKFPFSR